MATRTFGNQRFLELAQLGVGGMGVVYEVLDCERDVTVALKTLKTLEARQLLRFKNEFRALRDIRHPNLVELHELFEDQGQWFFTMELVDGQDFLAFVRPDARHFDEPRLRAALHGLGAGLAALHRAGKVHCDVKPSNVLVTESGRAVLLDFGVVTELRPSGAAANPRAGSPLYMAPEQSAGKSVAPAADWYAAGVLLFHALTGRVPFTGQDVTEVVQRKQREEPPHPSDIAPGLPEDLAGLCARMIARDPLHRPSQAEILDVLEVRDEHVRELGRARAHDYRLFVGRTQALGELRAAYAESRAGRVVSVFVMGESGVGKSALVEHFADNLERDDYAQVFRGQCHEREFVRYNAFDGIIDGVARLLRDAGQRMDVARSIEHVGPLLDLFPVLRNVPALNLAAAQVAGDTRRHAFAAMRQLFAALAAHLPVLLVIDDIHWADADSLELMRELFTPRDGPGLLLLATARNLEDGSACPARDAVGGVVRTVALSGLPADEAEELAERLWQQRIGRRSSTGVTGRMGQFEDGWHDSIAALVRETGGHPLFMDELLRYLARHGDAPAPRRAHLDDALRERIGELGGDARRILQLVAIAGMPIAYDVVAGVTSLPAVAFAEALSELRRGNFVRMQGRDRNAQVTVYHARVGDAIYRELAPDMRRDLHLQLARAMEAAGLDPVHLCGHFHRGGDAVRAAAYALDAARTAARSLAFDRAAELYRLALDAGPTEPGDASARAELITELGSCLENAGRVKQAADAYLQAATHLEAMAAGQESLEAPDQASHWHASWLELHRRAAEQLLAGGYLEQGIAAVTQVLERSGVKLPKTGRRALPGIAWSFFRLERHDLEWRTPSAAELEKPQRRKLLRRIDVCWTASAGLSLVDTVRGIFFATQGASLALRLGEPYRVARSLCTAAVAGAAVGEKESAARMIEAASRAAKEHGSVQALFYAETAAFVYHFFYQQNWSECVARGRALESLWRQAGHGRGSEFDFVVQFYSWALAMHGDIEELARFYDASVGDARRVGNRLLEVSLRAYHSLVRLARDEPMRSEDEIRATMESWPSTEDFYLQHAWALFSLGDIRLYRSEPEREYELRQDFKRLRKSPLRRTLWVRWREQYLVGRFALALAHRARLAHEASQLAGELARATTQARALARANAPVPRAFAALLRAGIAHLSGDDTAALAEIERATRGFQVTESALHQAAAMYRHGQLIGGDEGMGRIQEARTMLRRSGVARPENVVAMLSPGWGL